MTDVADFQVDEDEAVSDEVADEASESTVASDEFDAESTTVVDGEVQPKTRAPRIAPKYELAPVGALPTEAPVIRAKVTGRKGGGQGRSRNLFIELLTPIVEDSDLHDYWLEIAKYGTPAGAKGARKAIFDGERLLPEGTWQFEVRRFNESADGQPLEPGDEKGTGVTPDGTVIPKAEIRRVSKLYARFATTEDSLADETVENVVAGADGACEAIVQADEVADIDGADDGADD